MTGDAIQEKEGKITVYIQREDVLATVSTLARTVESLAKVLTQTPKVLLSQCVVNSTGDGIGISVQGVDKSVMREEELEVE